MTDTGPAEAETRTDPTSKLDDVMRGWHAHDGRSLLELSTAPGVLLVFLRHFGCPFCREAVADVKRDWEALTAGGVGVAFVHQATPEQADFWFNARGLAEVPRIADPERELYRAFDLRRGNLWQIGGPKVWWRSLQAAFKGHLVGRAVGDAFQMPGVFYVRDGAIVREFRHKSQADRPDYAAIERSA